MQAYQDIRHQLETEAGRINGRYGQLGWTPLFYLNQHFDRKILMKVFRYADVGLVTPLRDGMNPVAKEYVAAQDPADPGCWCFLSLREPRTNSLQRSSLTLTTGMMWRTRSTVL